MNDLTWLNRLLKRMRLIQIEFILTGPAVELMTPEEVEVLVIERRKIEDELNWPFQRK